MELFCPACQKKLIIEDQYAGQMMQCPMCQATFSAPALPSYAASASSLPSSSPPIPFAPGQAPPAPLNPPAQQYQPGPPPSSGYAPEQFQAGPPTPYVPPVRSTEYHRKWTIWLSPSVLQWVPVGAMGLVFILSFLPWLWCKSPVGTITQNGWQAAFGSYSSSDSTDNIRLMLGSADGPGVSLLSIFYILLLIPTLLLVIVAGLFGALRLSVPPSLHMVLSFRWVIAGSLCLLTFFLLVLQLLTGFALEHRIIAEQSSHSLQASEFIRNFLHHGPALSLVFWLHLLAVIVAGYLIFMDLRKTAPVPKVEIHW